MDDPLTYDGYMEPSLSCGECVLRSTEYNNFCQRCRARKWARMPQTAWNKAAIAGQSEAFRKMIEEERESDQTP